MCWWWWAPRTGRNKNRFDIYNLHVALMNIHEMRWFLLRLMIDLESGDVVEKSAWIKFYWITFCVQNEKCLDGSERNYATDILEPGNAFLNVNRPIFATVLNRIRPISPLPASAANASKNLILRDEPSLVVRLWVGSEWRMLYVRPFNKNVRLFH